MRILALGIGLPDPQIDNFNWASALSFFDYDAMIVEPAEAVSGLIRGILNEGASFQTYTDEPVQDGPTTEDAVGLADLLRRRRDETERLLARGGIVVVLAHPDVHHPHVSGFSGAHRYYWLPAPEGKDYGSKYLMPATGRHVMPTDYEHPFGDFLETMRDRVQFRAAIAEGAAGFGPSARVIGRSPGGAAVAAEIEVGGGKVVFLPALPRNLTHNERARVASGLVAAVRNAILTDSEEGAPRWVRDVDLPGLKEAEKRLEVAEDRFDEAERELIEARNEYRSADRYRRLLWQEGKYGLDLPVRDALALLGMTSTAKVDEPAQFLYTSEPILVEVEGSTGTVGMNPHYRLRQRLEHRITEAKRRPRGIIVVNGQRQTAPESRQKPFDDALRVAAESMRYCVVESRHLFDAVRRHLEGDESFDRAAFLRQLIDTEGVFVPPEPQAEAGADGDGEAEEVTESTTRDK